MSKSRRSPIDRPRRELAAISAMPDVQESFRKQGLPPAYLDSAKAAALIKSEKVRWREVAEKAGIKPE